MMHSRAQSHAHASTSSTASSRTPHASPLHAHRWLPPPLRQPRHVRTTVERCATKPQKHAQVCRSWRQLMDATDEELDEWETNTTPREQRTAGGLEVLSNPCTTHHHTLHRSVSCSGTPATSPAQSDSSRSSSSASMSSWRSGTPASPSPPATPKSPTGWAPSPCCCWSTAPTWSRQTTGGSGSSTGRRRGSGWCGPMASLEMGSSRCCGVVCAVAHVLYIDQQHLLGVW